jgi:hypothetical protein
VADVVDLLGPEREAYLAASKASMDATLDAKLVRDEEPSPERDQRLLAAMQRMVTMQVEALAAHDRLVARAERLGVTADVLAVLREGRAGLALQLQRTTAEVRLREFEE